MQKIVSNRKIKKIIKLLSANLPKQPTAIKSLYTLPPHLAEEVIKNDYSIASLQKILDHIGYYLGILKSVKLSYMQKPAEGAWIASTDGISTDNSDNSMAGLYQVKGFDRSEILLIKRNNLKQILAILAHECTHNYLFYHGIKESDETENEILTDIASAYLGLGHLLLSGYEPISWNVVNLLESSCKEHFSAVGYVSSESIKRAIVLSAESRDWATKEVVAVFPSAWEKITAYLKLYPHEVRRKLRDKKNNKKVLLSRKRSIQINNLKKDIDEILRKYNDIFKLINSPILKENKAIKSEDGKLLVEIANKISTGEIEVEINHISKKLNTINTAFVDNADISNLMPQIRKFKKTVSMWHKILKKYGDNK